MEPDPGIRDLNMYRKHIPSETTSYQLVFLRNMEWSAILYGPEEQISIYTPM